MISSDNTDATIASMMQLPLFLSQLNPGFSSNLSPLKGSWWELLEMDLRDFIFLKKWRIKVSVIQQACKFHHGKIKAGRNHKLMFFTYVFVQILIQIKSNIHYYFVSSLVVYKNN